MHKTASTNTDVTDDVNTDSVLITMTTISSLELC